MITRRDFLQVSAYALVGYGCTNPEQYVEPSFSGPIVGKPAPEFPKGTATILGKPISLEAYKNQVVLLDFWASWCGPCIKERPTILQVQRNNFYNKDFKLIGVGLDSDLKRFEQIVRGYSQTLTQVCDGKGFEGDIAKSYNIKMIPASILIDKKGIVRHSYVAPEELEKRVDELLAEK
jgi:thiol-disulfide isomerase/thioredoxin